MVLVVAAVVMAQDVAVTPTPGAGYGRVMGGQGMMNRGAMMGSGWVDQDKDGVCDNFTDADGDGVCDNAQSGARRMAGRQAGAMHGQGRAMMHGQGKGQGPLFSDADGDGVCDRFAAMHPDQTTP
jgi:hypothetical protein